ncbi:periodic tryptophan protein 1 homolog [Episyrphus balteatus]|uniref:periodic tryptophan protein 1 homolog n=1 Tax=Episyrphus balteatus TaxID=286459 RepID=UPI0024861810|nr:periodic tryptophan protein 1 homolog [Episyrphus balteatus]
MEEEINTESEATVNFVPVICFVKRGIAKERPEKIVLTQEELARVIKETKSQIAGADESDASGDEDDSASDAEMDTIEPSEAPALTSDEFNFDNYDNEGDVRLANIANIAEVDPDHDLEDDEDSEAEDEIIKPTDNLLLVGHVADDAASLEVWIFNEEEESLYTHHEFILPSFPLCIEWLNHDPGSETAGNLCAVGFMDPIITIWDLDIQDLIEPTFKLGSKGNRKKNKAAFGHTDAVLDLSWNKQFPHILASGSVDQSVILWDLDEGKPHTTITSFKEKVQSIEFHSTDAQNLLTGCADGRIRLYDCRNAEAPEEGLLKWKVRGGEVEKVLWNPVDMDNFIVGTSDGQLHYADRRKPSEFLWSTKAHNEEISGICFNPEKKNLLTTTSTDGILKVWKFDESLISQVYEHDFDMGILHCMRQCPEDPYTLAFGGAKVPRCRVFNIKNFEAVRRAFDIPSVLE